MTDGADCNLNFIFQMYAAYVNKKTNCLILFALQSHLSLAILVVELSFCVIDCCSQTDGEKHEGDLSTSKMWLVSVGGGAGIASLEQAGLRFSRSITLLSSLDLLVWKNTYLKHYFTVVEVTISYCLFC
ncbi:hypothetical protein VTO42DRAFT_7726 [Malbranchea cinnamomea]